MINVIIILSSAIFLIFLWVFILGRELIWAKRQMAWEIERITLVAEVFNAARAIQKHTFDWGGGGNLSFQGTLLNYETLSKMVMLNQEQSALVLVAMDHVALFELEHPPPKPPTVFGKRLVLV